MEVGENCRIDLRLLYQLRSDGQLALLKWCMLMKLIPKEFMCPKCRRSMILTKKNSITDGYMWVCRTRAENAHQIKRSVRSFSWFNDRRLSILNVLLMSYLWIKKAGTHFIMDELGATFITVSEGYSYCRQVCVEICLLESEVIGGEGITVEILETRFTQGKNLRFKGASGKWLIIGIEKGTNKYFYTVSENKNKETLLNVIKHWVLPGSVLISDLWKAYNCLTEKKFKLLKISQNLTLQCPSKKHSATSENIFGTVKNLTRGSCSNEVFILHLAEYIWRRSHNDNVRSLIKSFYKSLPKIYQPQNCDYAE